MAGYLSHHHYHHHGVAIAQIPLTSSCHSSLIGHCPLKDLETAPSVSRELMNSTFGWSTNNGLSMSSGYMGEDC